jgi:hypothetical protein
MHKGSLRELVSSGFVARMDYYHQHAISKLSDDFCRCFPICIINGGIQPAIKEGE